MKIHYKNGKNLAETDFSVVVNHLLGPQYKKLVEKMELLGQVSDAKNKIRHSKATETIADVTQSVKKKTRFVYF